MMFNLTKPKTTEQDDIGIPPMPSKDRSFEKKLRWLITNPPAAAEKWTITPEMADVMLQWNDRNRPLRQSAVDAYADLMAAGRWRFTGEPIIFSPERLIDGQNRLSACKKSGVCFDALVVFGAPDEAFAFIDVGKARTASDIFAIHGVKNWALMAAATQWVVGYEAGTLATAAYGKMRMDHAALHDAYEKHSALQDSAWVGHLFAANKLASPSTMVALHYLAARKGRREADDFFRKVAEGVGIASKKEPAHKLRARLIDSASSQEKLGRKQMAALTVKAWNAHRLGRDVGALKFSADETFPKVI